VHNTSKIVWPALLILCWLTVGCLTKQYPADSDSVKYANRTTPGAKINLKRHLVPGKMNLIYVFADG
jgi:hypothetical protein